MNNKLRCIGGSQHNQLVGCVGTMLEIPTSQERYRHQAFSYINHKNGEHVESGYWILTSLSDQEAARLIAARLISAR